VSNSSLGSPAQYRPETFTVWPGILFIGATALAAGVYVLLEIANNSHASAYYDLLQYALILPALLWFWRRSQGESTAPVSMPDLRGALIVVFFVLTAIVGSTYDHGHTISDESSYLFQARVFASGHLKAEPMPGATANAAATPREIYFEHQIDTVRGWFSKYPPGWPLALAIGYWLHCPWLVNPVLGVLLLLLVNHVAGMWGRPTQIAAVLMASASAYTMLYSIGFMSHALAAVAGLAALAAILHAVRTERLIGVVLCFAMVALGTGVRPYTGAVIALLCSAYTVYGFRHKPKRLWPAFGIICAAGLCSITLFLLVNRTYTGEFLLSPYAYSRGAARVPELTVNSSVIFHNLAQAWRWSLTDTVRTTFPLVLLAAGFACWKEREYRREVIFLALLFPMLAIAHIFQSEGSGSFDGERYYYEGYAGLGVVAARGFLLVTSDWRVGRRAVMTVLISLTAVQAVLIAFVIRDVESHLAPSRMAYRASMESPIPKLVFLSGDAPAFTAKHVNWNDANWKSEPVTFLNDPGIARRDEVACRFGDSAYRVVSYDEKLRKAVSRDFEGACPAR
jgi:hypothetical protein